MINYNFCAANKLNFHGHSALLNQQYVNSICKTLVLLNFHSIQKQMYQIREMLSYFITYFIIFTTHLKLTFSDCSVSFFPKLTTSGSIQAIFYQGKSGQNITESFDYPLHQELRTLTDLHYMVGISGLSLNKKSQDFGFKIQVKSKKRELGKLTFVIYAYVGGSLDRWSFFHLNFCVSQSPKIILGTRNLLQLKQSSEKNRFLVSQKIEGIRIEKEVVVKCRIFLGGVYIKEKSTLSEKQRQKMKQKISKIESLRSYSWNIVLIKKFVLLLSTPHMPSLSIPQNSVLINQNGFLSFSILTSQLQLKLFTYSYLIYFQGIISRVNYITSFTSFQVSESQHFQIITSFSRNPIQQFFGISSFLYSPQWQGDFRLSSKIQNQNIKQFSAILQGPYAEFTFEYFAISIYPSDLCKDCPQSPILYEQFCVRECPNGYALSINSDGAYYCNFCQIQKFLVPSQDRVRCQCAHGHYLVSPTRNCEICPYDCLTCTGNKCLTCDTQQQYTHRFLNKSTNRCQCKLKNSQGQSLYDDSLNKLRVCSSCNFRCLTCKGPSVSDCLSCQKNRILVGGICRCDKNLVENSSNACECISPFSLSKNGTCILVQKKCPQNQRVQMNQKGDIQCQCLRGYFRSFLTNRCIRECNDLQYLNSEKEICECKKGLGLSQITGLCQSCSQKVNQVYNEVQKKCQCVEGFQMNSEGVCITCPSKSFYRKESKGCVCVFNYYQKYPNGPCVKCKNESQGNGCRKISNME